MATKNLKTLDIRVGTGEQLATLETNPDAIEFQTDGQFPASSVSFDNTNTGLTAMDVQAAIKQIATAVPPAPAAAGTYVLKITVADEGTSSMQWVAEA